MKTNYTQHSLTIQRKSAAKSLAFFFVLFLLAFLNTNAQTVVFEKVVPSGCYYYSGASKTTISVQVGWTGANSSDQIVVTLDGTQTRTILVEHLFNPGSGSDVAGPMKTPQVVAFEINADGLSHTLTAVMSGAHSATATPASVMAPAACIPMPCNGTDLAGMVFYDNNADGVHQSGETNGVPNVTVTATDKNGVQYTATSDINGKYFFNSSFSNAIPANAFPVRVEFTDFPTNFLGNSGPSISGNSSSVRFVNLPTCSLDCGAVNPLNYSQSNPKVFGNLYTNNNPLAGGSAGSTPALISHNYNSNSDISYTTIATSAQIGSVWAKAWNKFEKKMFVAAFLKRHSGLGPLGLGGLYMVDNTNPASPVFSNFMDLTTIGINFGQAAVGTNASRGLGSNKLNPNADGAAFAQVGKAGIGNMDFSDDGNTLYIMNLYDKKVYAIDMSNYFATSTLPTSAEVSSITIPTPSCSNGSFRPFALKIYNNKMYVGLVCDGSTGTTSNMVALVKAMDLSTNVWTDVFDFPLTYPKGFPDQGDASKTGWYVWSDVISQVWNGSGNILHPVPMLSDIEFDLDGTMVLALMDRTSHQMGNYNYDNAALDAGSFTAAGGDILRAYYSNGTYILENNAKAGPVTGYGPNNNQGPGFGEFYNDNINGGQTYHTEMGTGGLTLLPGSGEVMAGMVDPSFYNGGPLWANGPRRMSNTTGLATGAMAYYSDNGIASFGKANGMGDIELASDNVSYIELGNYVWKDTDKDGVQDPTESGIAGVVMRLYNATTGAQVATSTTDANGNYYFSTLSGSTILPNTNYVVLAGVGQYNSTDSTITSNGIKYRITLTNIGQGPNLTLNDNNFSMLNLSSALGSMPAGYPLFNVTTGDAGYINHTIDLGLKALPGLGDTAWYDANRNGLQDASELPVQNLKVYLTDNAGVKLDSTTTNTHGYYQFINLEPNTLYKVQFTTPGSNYAATGQNQGTNDSLDSDADADLFTQAVSMEYNEFNPTLDAGFYLGGTLGNYVWMDTNQDGLQNEPSSNGINGVDVFLYKDNGSGYVKVDSTTTANNGSGNPGYYNFIIPTSGNYKVFFPTSIGANILTTQTGTAGTDGNSDATIGTGFSPVIVMNLGGSGVQVNNPTIDAGYYCYATVNPLTGSSYMCNSSTTVFASTTPSGTWSSSNNAVATVSNAGVISSHSAGSATITYTVVTACGSMSVTKLITVVQTPAASFTVNDNTQCLSGNTFQFTISTPQASTRYTINYGDGHIDSSFASSFTHSYAAVGSYTISVTAMDTLASCNTSATSSVSISQAPTVSLWLNDSTQCVGSNIFAFLNYSTTPVGSITSTYWNFGDGQDTTVTGTNPVDHNYASVGNFNVIAVVNNTAGCTAQDTIPLTVVSGPVAGFNLSQVGCCGDILVSNTSTNANAFEWTFSSTSSSHEFTCTYSTSTFTIQLNPGTYNVTLVAKGDGDCIDTLRQTFVVLPKPNAVFSATIDACGTTAQFNNYSFGSSTYSWNFGDPTSGAANTSTLQNPSHLFTNIGTYTVTLVSYNAGGCNDTMYQTVVINPSLGVVPVASFTYANAGGTCANKLTFTSTSSNASSYLWIFPDGGTANTASVNETFATAGSYTVKLAATSSTGCTDTATQTIVIASNSNGPSAAFTVVENNQCLPGNSFNFLNTSTYTGIGWNNSYNWDFGDGTFDNTNTFAFNKKYTTAGTFIVRLIANSVSGCKDTAYQVVVVKPAPVMSFTTGNTCGKNITFTNTTTGSIGNYWNMGDGGIPCFDSTSFTHHYSSIGWYDVQLVSVGANGCFDTLTQGIGVNRTALPTPSFTYDTANCAHAIVFHNTSIGGGNYTWNFGDGSPIDSSTHAFKGYNAAGTYNVTLTAFVGPGCSASITQVVNAPKWNGSYLPVAKFGYHVDACTNTIHATGTSTNVTMQKWLFDEVVVAWGPSVTVPTPSIGGHKLQYVVSNGTCYDTLTQYFQIQGAPMASFDILNSACSNTILFTSGSKNANTLRWNFGDGATLADTALGTSVSYTYPANGTFSVQLVASDLYGCTDTITQSVVVTKAFNPHIANFTYDNSLCNCRCSNSVKFTNLTNGTNNTYLWNFGDGTTSTQASPSKGFGAAGTYVVTLTSIDSAGCMSTISKSITITSETHGPSASFNTDYQVQCLSTNNFIFYNTSTYMGSGWVRKYYWNFGDGTIDTTNTFVFNKHYAAAGNYVVRLVAEGAEGCKDTMTMYIQIRPEPCTGVLKFVNLLDGSNWNINPELGGGIASGVTTIENTIEYNLYPNPNTGNFKVLFNKNVNEALLVKVLDIYGREVYVRQIESSHSNELNVNTEGLAEGTYFLTVSGETGTYKETKFVVIK